jgi:hypothetical protein
MTFPSVLAKQRAAQQRDMRLALAARKQAPPKPGENGALQAMKEEELIVMSRLAWQK